ncbi:MarR family winged helix-turn-helix transcriptional regulator [Flammeovirga sp. SJP92]|uniref:MarR family winged helix-turn-helix transcriptional regulator n=1 Tax=Flammeovirga sp. SJP92 TaxID=1775430 RepID=UPI0007891EF6|nr:MarR family winged helix-turn-helix transcriptional regulator [Flammeovirga sp. SJP92]KXX71124.1 MarR family transcriptional regulator [Flammeovirga sp. SJP92]
MNIESKIVNGLERLSEALKALLWEKAKTYGISPIQIQILLFVAKHKREICNVSYLAKEFNVTKATISDAVRVLIKKEYLEKDYSPTDNRRYNLLVTSSGEDLVQQLSGYADVFNKELSSFNEQELANIFDTLSKLIFQLNQKGIIQVQRTCYNCKYYSGDKKENHHCNLLNSKLKGDEIRIDCDEFEG